MTSSRLRRISVSMTMTPTATSITPPKTTHEIHSGSRGRWPELTNDTPSPAATRIKMQRKMISAIFSILERDRRQRKQPPRLSWPLRRGIMGPMDPRAVALDTTVEIITPENIAFRYYLAGPFRRLPAFAIDMVIQLFAGWAVMFGMMMAFGSLRAWGVGFGLTLLFWFALFFFYGGLFETFWNGQTPGKRLLHIRVVALDGQPINGMQAILRNVLRILDAFPLLFGGQVGIWQFGVWQVGLWAATASNRFQRLGDLAAGTMVVIEERQRMLGMTRIADAEALRLAALLPANYRPSRTLAAALAAYVQRRRAFSPGRRLEIARHVGEPLRRRFELPAGTDLHALLCGLYRHTFLSDKEEAVEALVSPFGEPTSPFAQGEIADRLATAAVANAFGGPTSPFAEIAEPPARGA